MTDLNIKTDEEKIDLNNNPEEADDSDTSGLFDLDADPDSKDPNNIVLKDILPTDENFNLENNEPKIDDLITKSKDLTPDNLNKNKDENLNENKNKPVEIDWENEANNFKNRHKAASDWGSQVNQNYIKLEQENKKLQADIQNLRESLDIKEFDYTPPTIDSAKDFELEVFRQKVKVSEDSAITLLGGEDLAKGKEELVKLIGPGSGFEDLIKLNPELSKRFTSSDAPIHEAIRIMNESKSNTSPTNSNINIEELKTTIRNELLAEFKQNDITELLKNAPQTLLTGRVNKPGSNPSENEDDDKPEPLSSMLGLG